MGRLYAEFLGGARGVALLLLRLVFGVGMTIHGSGKIQNPTGWMGDALPGYLQAAAAISEFGGGLCWVLGALTPLASLGLIGTMGFATFMVHVRMGDPFVNLKHDGKSSTESAAGYLAIAIFFLIVGPGRLSVDSLLFGRGPVIKPEPAQKLGG